MLLTHTLTLNIARSYERVYRFLSDPETLPRWAQAVNGQTYHQVEGMLWEYSQDERTVQLRFTPPNPFGVLDYAIIEHGVARPTVRVRAWPNEESTTVTYTMVCPQRLSAQRFASEVEWLSADLQVLKTYLESL